MSTFKLSDFDLRGLQQKQNGHILDMTEEKEEKKGKEREEETEIEEKIEREKEEKE